MAELFNRVNTGYLSPISSSIDKLQAASNGLMCLKSAIMGAFMSPASIISGLASIGASLISSIVSAVSDVIMKRVNQVVDSLLSPLRKIQALIADVTAALAGIQNILNKATDMNNWFNNKQDCSGFAAQILNCLAQKAINKITTKIAMKVDASIGKIADSVSKGALKAGGGIDSFVNKHTSFIEKGSLQGKLLA